MLNVQPLPGWPVYRGFRLGYVQGPHGYRAAWKSSLEDDWTEGHIYLDTLAEVEELAKECIDFNYRYIEPAELVLGRPLTLDEVMNLKRE